MELTNRAAIVGVGHTAFARSIPDKTPLQLRCEAAKLAADDAGVSLRNIDGLIIAESSASPSGPYGNPRIHMEFSEILGMFETSLCMTAMGGGSSPGLSVEIARYELTSGRCKYVLILAGFKGSESGRSERGHARSDRLAKLTMHYPDYEHPFGPIMPTFYATIATRHMYEFGTTEEQLASIPVAARYNAGLNPDAIYRTPISVDDVFESKPISSPFHLLHCCMISDGALAFVMTTEERARDLKHKPVFVLGGGGGQAGYYTGFLAGGGVDKGFTLTRTIAKRAADDAFEEAGVGRNDIDFVTCCDNFAITPLVQLEDFGFCEKGEGGSFIGKNGDRIKVGGELPVNPHGGLLSCNHAAANYQNYIEATLQLRGSCGDRQVDGAKLALATASAGIISTHYVHVVAVD
jgi:acetyl-CoA acetyltransferase